MESGQAHGSQESPYFERVAQLILEERQVPATIARLKVKANFIMELQ